MKQKQAKNQVETREFQFAELRVDPSAEWPIVGYPAVFEQLSVPLWGFREKVRRGAFSKTIREADVRALFNHDPNYVLGRNRSGTLQLEEDERGLMMMVKPPDASWAEDLMTSIKRKDIDQGSFVFRTRKEEWDESDPKNIVRTLVEVDLFDVSVVTYPAYPDTNIKARGMELIERLRNTDGDAPDDEEIQEMIDALSAHRSRMADNGAKDAPISGDKDGGEPQGDPENGLEPEAGDADAQRAGGPAGLSLKRKLLELLSKI